jgi:DNA polymerase III epsilon subunit-like protein
MHELKLFAKHYKTIGLNVTCIGSELTDYNFYSKNLLKTPNHSWKHFFETKQSEEEFNSLNWEQATGVGTLTGYRDLVVLDIDGCNDYDFLDQVLRSLRLPINYEWVTVSGSNNGFHIFFNCSNYNLEKNQVVVTYPPNKEFSHFFEKVEVLWRTHVVLPPSIHKSGNYYKYLNCKFPKQFPTYVDYRQLSIFLDKYLISEKKIIGSTYGDSIFEFIPPKVISDLEDIEIRADIQNPIFCIIDTETDGLPQKKFTSVIYPNVVQIAWILGDAYGNILKKETELINYPNIKWTDAFAINQINIEVVKKIGGSPSQVYQKLVPDIKISDYIVCHNVNFDIPIIINELKKYGLQDILSNKKSICTMTNSVDICKISSPHGDYNYPKLEELFYGLFDKTIKQKHDAEADALITYKCFVEMINIGAIDL